MKTKEKSKRLNLTITNSKVIEVIEFIAKEEGITKAKVVVGRFLEQVYKDGYKISLKDLA